MEELEEAVSTLDDVQNLLDDLVVSGLRSVAPATLNRLRGHCEEFGKIGAEHLSEQLGTLIQTLEADDRKAAEAMVRLQTGLRLFERLLSTEAAAAALQHLVESQSQEAANDQEETE